MPPAIRKAIITTMNAIGMSFCQDRYSDWFIGQYHGSFEPRLFARLGGRKPHSILGGVEDGEHAMYPEGHPLVGPLL